MAKKQGKKANSVSAKSNKDQVNIKEKISNEEVPKEPEKAKNEDEITEENNHEEDLVEDTVKNDEPNNTNDKREVNKKWVDLVRTNRVNPGCALTYIPPLLSNGLRIAKIFKEDEIEEEERWQHTIIGCVCTRERSRMSYARVLVEMRLKGTFPDAVIIEDQEGKQHTQFVEYECKPRDNLVDKVNEGTPKEVTLPSESKEKIIEDDKEIQKQDTFSSPKEASTDDGFQLVVNRKQKNKMTSKIDDKTSLKAGGNSKNRSIMKDSIDRLPPRGLLSLLIEEDEYPFLEHQGHE
ncbi:uncharacterized protein LOC126681614 [Mercurialis annua]|uniref:uncharacterized protein LOC126681614 n=1 Tax=Mercurialis annua TaxID=3986 RepID=UPI00215F2A7E|nr:uncharacterized protein LOC126681614 [Mercurialis annua]